jgi:phosphate transport system permease protein
MSPALLLLLALGLGLVGWLAARARAWSFRHAAPGGRLAALPSYHAWYVALWVVVPALAFAVFWNVVSPQLIGQSVLADPAAAQLPPFGMERETILAEARNVATGAATGVFHPAANALVGPFREAIGRYDAIGLAVTLLIALAAGAFGFLRLKPDFAARTKVERAVMMTLLLASLVAILTTVGIFVSLVFETVRFLRDGQPDRFPVRDPLGSRPDEQRSRDPTRRATARCRCSGARSTSVRSSR